MKTELTRAQQVQLQACLDRAETRINDLARNCPVLMMRIYDLIAPGGVDQLIEFMRAHVEAADTLSPDAILLTPVYVDLFLSGVARAILQAADREAGETDEL